MTGTGSSRSNTIALISGPRAAYLFGFTDQCEVAVPAMGAQPMGLGSGEYYKSLTASTSYQTCTVNQAATTLCGKIDELLGSSSWTASCIGVFAGFRDSMYIYSDSSATNTAATITKSGNTVRIKADAGYSVSCYCDNSTVRLGFYPMYMFAHL